MTGPPLTAPVDLLRPAPQLAAATTRERIAETAQDFEAGFLSIMLGQMMSGVGEGGEFSGGQGEAMFKSFLTDAIARQITRTGGLGIADTVQREMLKLQGLEDPS